MITELAKRAGLYVDADGEIGPAYMGSVDAGYRKFAELIVRECCDWIDGSPSTDAGQLLLTKSFIIANLKGHFGVEE
jgi:hypothetical protein